MPTPRTLALAIVSSALIFIPSAFADGSKTQEVMIEVDLDAAPEATYESIRRQAWKVCKPETGTTYMSAVSEFAEIARIRLSPTCSDSSRNRAQFNSPILSRTRHTRGALCFLPPKARGLGRVFFSSVRLSLRHR